MLNENEIIINGKVIEIKPIKMKYIRTNFYKYYITLKKIGLFKISSYADGITVIDGFIKSVFNDDDETIEFLLENMTEKDLKQILDIVKVQNEIDDEADLKN